MKNSWSWNALDNTSEFIGRHIGPSDRDAAEMLKSLGLRSLDELVDKTVPAVIRMKSALDLHESKSENEMLSLARERASKNQIFKSFLGMGYHGTHTPTVILRNILENPGWYTAYTPYQAEIAQGRLEALLNFQTMVMELTAMPIANASLLDEGTAAAEAMTMFFHDTKKKNANVFFVSRDTHPQTIEVLQTRARPLGIELVIGDHATLTFSDAVFGALVQYPGTSGTVEDFRPFVERAHASKVLVCFAADLLSLTLLTPPGEMGADVVIGSTQRFGVPMGFGGPHAAYFATRDELKRSIPGRIIGVSVDTQNRPALRLALQTREQHIRREKATSNICTAQVLLAVIASMYSVYHGPEGLRRIASRTHFLASIFAEGARRLGARLASTSFFDTVEMEVGDADAALNRALSLRMNLRKVSASRVSVAFDETHTPADVEALWRVLAAKTGAQAADKAPFSFASLASSISEALPANLLRTSGFLAQKVFNSYHSESEMLRYLNRLQSKDLSLTHSMIPLGSCTMKLNATSEMIPITWPEFGQLHPFAPLDQAQGYLQMIRELESWLGELTGFAGVSLQPNAGSQGEYAGLLVIRKYHEARGESHRNVCLIPASAHGTNPASAVMAGMKVVVVGTDDQGNVDINDLRAKAHANAANLSALMITYPSTHGVFEEGIQEICEIVHQAGGQVYMDGANFNALVGLARPGDFGPDVCHLNLHKTFCIPHGGGGPGIGPIGVAKHLKAYLPGHHLAPISGGETTAVSAAPWGSASILPISWAYIAMMGRAGLKRATEIAILNANYIAQRLAPHYPILYKGRQGYVAHECILDLRPLKATSGVEVEDVAKRLMDYGFHAPTMSWPVAGTLMIEPTESESKAELDRFCEAMIGIRDEIRAIENGQMDRERNPLKLAPHTAADTMATQWDRPYTREQGAFPLAWVRERKFWPPVSRINNPHGDRNLVCSCAPLESYAQN
ncbi:MAG: aminomethyl-transferring glycine dehydrogenase [Bdellovibrionaceae bacterium]|nr:aminomethyl-transferring glycine dehydrogenase [Pseudobdellovibrionaceae bacterium]